MTSEALIKMADEGISELQDQLKRKRMKPDLVKNGLNKLP